VERAAVLRGAAAHAPVEATLVDRREAAWLRDPRERLLRRGERARVSGLDAEVDEREQPPERAAPFPVRVNAVVLREPADERVTHGR
jgi:hypothetical protein